MGDQEKKSSIQALAAGFLGFIGVVGLGGLLILRHGGASSEAPVVSYAPVDADSGLRAPARALPAPSVAASVASSPAPLLSDEVRGESAVPAGEAARGAPVGSAANAAAVNNAAAAGSIPASARLAAGSRLDGGSSASSSASVAVSTSVAASSKSNPLSGGAKKPFFAPKLDLSKNQGTVASTVHYGVSDRHELMGRAAGPVYNFSGKSEGQARSGQVAADNAGPGAAGAMRQMDAAQKKLDASDVSAGEKAKLDQDLNQVRRTAASAAADSQ